MIGFVTYLKCAEKNGIDTEVDAILSRWFQTGDGVCGFTYSFEELGFFYLFENLFSN